MARGLLEIFKEVLRQAGVPEAVIRQIFGEEGRARRVASQQVADALAKLFRAVADGIVAETSQKRQVRWQEVVAIIDRALPQCQRAFLGEGDPDVDSDSEVDVEGVDVSFDKAELPEVFLPADRTAARTAHLWVSQLKVAVRPEPPSTQRPGPVTRASKRNGHTERQDEVQDEDQGGWTLDEEGELVVFPDPRDRTALAELEVW